MKIKGVTQEQWNRWFEWHAGWIERRNDAYRKIKSQGYGKREEKDLIEIEQKKYLAEFWDTRKLILGY